MRYILILLFGLLCFGAEAQIQAKQVKGGADSDSLYVMLTDSITGSNTKGLGKWYLARTAAGFFGDKDWIKYGTTKTIPNNTDTMFHNGVVTIGSDVAQSGVLNVSGRIDARFPDENGTNIIIGNNSGYDGVSFLNNVAVGNSSLSNASGGVFNVAVGDSALYSITSGDYNMGIGARALYSATTGIGNTAIGEQALSGATIIANTAIGRQAGYGGATSFNTIIGYEAGYSSPVSNNVFVGYQSGRLNVGSGNVFVGKESGENETGSNKLYIENSNSATPLIGGDFSTDTVRVNGDLSVRDMVAGASTDSIVVWTPSNGRLKMRNASDIGVDTDWYKYGGTEIPNNTDTMFHAGVVNIYETGSSLPDATGVLNVSGRFHLVSPGSSIIIGKSAGASGLGNLNIGIGYAALTSLTSNVTSRYNVAIGYQSMTASTSAKYNTSIGYNSMLANLGADYNCALGAWSLGANTTGERNFALGAFTMYQNSTGSGNVGIGAWAAFNVLGDKNIMIGDSSGYSETGSQKLYIDPSATSTPLIHGDFAADSIRINGELSVLTVDAGATTDSVMVWNPSTGKVGMRDASSLGGGTDTYATVEVSGTPVSTNAPTLDFDGTDFSVSEGPTDDFDIQIQAERIQDIAGAMVTGNTETGITVTYQDADGTIDFVADDQSATNELNTIQEGDATVQTSNSTLDFQALFDVATDGAGEVDISLDLSEATTITTPESDDYVIMHDAGLNQHQKVLWQDLYDLTVDGNGIYDGDGTTPTGTDVTLTDNLDFNSGLLYLDGSSSEVGIGTTSPDAAFEVETNGGFEMLLNDNSSLVELYTKSDVGGTGNSFKLLVQNTDGDLSTDYPMGSIEFIKANTSSYGGSIEFDVGYNSSSTDNVLNVVSRPSGASDGVVEIAGGMRYKWEQTASTSFSPDLGDYGFSMTSASTKTVTLPSITEIGTCFEFFNSGSGTATINAGGGNTIHGDNTLSQNESLKVIAVTSTKWTISN